MTKWIVVRDGTLFSLVKLVNGIEMNRYEVGQNRQIAMAAAAQERKHERMQIRLRAKAARRAEVASRAREARADKAWAAARAAVRAAEETESL